MDPSFKTLTFASYVEYFMKHNGVASWLSTCYMDCNYPKEALAGLRERINSEVGQPLMPAFVMKMSASSYIVVDYVVRINNFEIIAQLDDVYTAFGVWARYILFKMDGMLSPRVSCKGLLERILNEVVVVAKDMDMDEDLRTPSKSV